MCSYHLYLSIVAGVWRCLKLPQSSTKISRRIINYFFWHPSFCSSDNIIITHIEYRASFDGQCVGTLQQAYPLLLQQGRTRVIICNYAIRGGAAGPHGSGSYFTGPMAPDPLPALGQVRRRHVSLRRGSSEPTTEGSDPP